MASVKGLDVHLQPSLYMKISDIESSQDHRITGAQERRLLDSGDFQDHRITGLQNPEILKHHRIAGSQLHRILDSDNCRHHCLRQVPAHRPQGRDRPFLVANTRQFRVELFHFHGKDVSQLHCTVNAMQKKR